ncbi:unnamed protein product [Camellia sinensis]
MGKLLALQPLQMGHTVEEIEFRWCPFWVQVHGLPLNNLTQQNEELLGNRIGRLVRVEAHTEGLLLSRNFLRIRVEIDTQQPLPQGLWLQRSKEGCDSWLTFKYEKLSDYCYDCGRLGHESNACKFVSKKQGASSSYGPHLRTGIAPPTGLPVEHYRRKVDELERQVISGLKNINPTPYSPASPTARDHPSTELLPPQRLNPSIPLSRTESCTAPLSFQRPASGEMPGGAPSNPPPVLLTPQATTLELGPQNSHAHSKRAKAHGSDQNLGLVSTQASTGKGPLEPLDQPRYYVTEPPDSPISGPAQFAGSVANTEVIQQLTLKSPISSPSPTQPPYLLDGLLSTALTQLSLKRKEVDVDSPYLPQAKCLRKEGQVHPMQRVLQIALPPPNIELHKPPVNWGKARGGKSGSHRVRKSISTNRGLIDVHIAAAEATPTAEVTYPGGEETIVPLADNSMAVGTASGWTPPRVGTAKVNCDASFHGSSAKASAAAIMRNSKGQFIDGIVTSFFSASALQVEAVAVCLVCCLAQMHGLSLADIENDNQELIHLCVSETVPPWEIMAVVADIRSFARDRAWKFMWTRRTNNSAAH